MFSKPTAANAILTILFTCILLSAIAQASTRTAASCNASDVQAAINTAQAGDTVVIPAGTCTWTAQVSWTAPANVILQGQTTCSGTPAGSCTDNTLIVDNLNRTSLGDIPALSIVTNSSGSFRLTGITIQGSTNSSAQTWNGSLIVSGTSQQFRFDHSHLKNIDAIAMSTYGQVYGVMDHDLFDLSTDTTNNGVRFNNDSWGGGSNNFGDGSWADATTLGSNRFIFIEDSTFQASGGQVNPFTNDCSEGGRWVLRHNAIINANTQTHPTGGGARHRGCRAWEFYDNVLSGSSSSPSFNVFFVSSGTGVIWGNTAATGYENFVSIHSMRRDNSTYGQSPTPGGWGYCGTSFNGTGSAWDQNANPSTGYACLDQPGQGVGQLLANDFPNTINTVTGTIAWPHEALEPIYEWLDSWTPAPGYPNGQFWNNYESDVLGANRDYYLYTPTFNGTSGVGSGLSTARPSTCTTGVAYWATDSNTLYKCTSTNTWTQFYTPYTYPHPLTQGGGNPPAPPSNLQATPQ